MAYQVINEIGQGGFAKVFNVENDVDGKRYAKKVFFPLPTLIAAVGEEHLKKRFIREVKYQSTVNHNNIVPIIADMLGETPPSFIMPLADCTLKEELLADPTLGGSFEKVLFDILAGLEEIHSKGFFHRDLKPANILKFSDSGSTKYAISDFGLMMASKSDSSTLTGTNAGGGTENYSAPELIGGFRRATAAADIYSFGAILHDMFGNGSHRIPYTELTLPGAIGGIIEKCTKRLPVRRYNGITSLREDLYNVLKNQTIHFTSTREEAAIGLLKTGDPLTDDQWDSIFLLIENNSAGNISNSNIFDAFTASHLKILHQNAPDLFTALGHYFSEHIQHGTFAFEFCDILASQAEIFFLNGELGLKAEIALALMALGTSHNRWYVERKFVNMVNNNIDNVLAERIKTEIEVQNIAFGRHIRHLESSIGFTKDALHPILFNILTSIQ